MWPGVGEAYVLPSSMVKDHKIWFTKQIFKKLVFVQERAGLHRVQCSVDATDQAAMDWIEQKRFGFKCEGRMKKYGADGHDHYRYARVK